MRAMGAVVVGGHHACALRTQSKLKAVIEQAHRRSQIAVVIRDLRRETET